MDEPTTIPLLATCAGCGETYNAETEGPETLASVCWGCFDDYCAPRIDFPTAHEVEAYYRRSRD